MKALLPRRWRPVSGFERACLAAMAVRGDRDLTDLERQYVEFALSTNARGVTAARTIARFRTLRGARCLDVGCAYGGFLVALAWRGAGELVGIDLDERLLGLARVNLADHGVGASLRVADVEDPAAVGALGLFDVVVCNAVLEHVRDPAATIGQLCRLTAPGGLVYAVIPNRNHPRALLSDEHYRLQGLTLLGRRDAERYHGAALGQTSEYDVGRYRPLAFYLHHFRRHGLAVEVEDAGSEGADLGRLRADFEEARASFEGWSPPGVPADVAAKMRSRFAVVHRAFLAMVGRGEVDAVSRRFGMAEWLLVARRPTAPQGSAKAAT